MQIKAHAGGTCQAMLKGIWPAQDNPVDPDIDVQGVAVTSAHGSHLAAAAAAAAVGWDLTQPLHFCHIQQLQVPVLAFHNMTKMQTVAGSESVLCRDASSLAGQAFSVHKGPGGIHLGGGEHPDFKLPCLGVPDQGCHPYHRACVCL